MCLVEGKAGRSINVISMLCGLAIDGIIPAVHMVPGTMIIMESSAEMAGTWYREFYEAAKRGANSFEAVFVPWILQPEYHICPICRRVFPEICIDPENHEKAGL